MHGRQESIAKMNSKMNGKINNKTPTKCIYHKGFSGYASVTAHSNFCVGGQETALNPLRHIH